MSFSTNQIIFWLLNQWRWPNIYSISPVKLLAEQIKHFPESNLVDSLGPSLWKEDTKCLDQNKPDSIVYIYIAVSFFLSGNFKSQIQKHPLVLKFQLPLLVLARGTHSLLSSVPFPSFPPLSSLLPLPFACIHLLFFPPF